MKVLSSFKYATNGVRLGLQEHNMKVHLAVTIFVVLMGISYSITRIEWVAVLLSIGLVISTELLNTALEELCDVMVASNNDAYPKLGDPKDIGAGAVLVAAIIAACVGLLVFVPYIF